VASTRSSAPPPPYAGRSGAPQRVILRSVPKICFLYPTLLASALATILVELVPEHTGTWGSLFLAITFFNMIVLAFDFPRTASFTVVALVVAAVVGAFLINEHLFAFWGGLRDGARDVRPEANSQFYGLFAAGMALIFLVVLLVDVRLDYWEILPNQIIHHRGWLGDENRGPAPGLNVQKEITDVFEFFLLRSGRLILQPASGPPFILDHVPNVNKRTDEVAALLKTLDVTVSGMNRS
jgi:hypothetical protein